MPTRMSVPSRDISLHFLENEAVLFDRQSQRLYAVNASAAFILCCLQENMMPADIAMLLADRFRLASATAEQYVDEAVRQWQMSSLIEEDLTPQAPAPSDLDDPLLSKPADALADPQLVRHYRLLDSIVSLHFESGYLLRRVTPLLNHLTLPAGRGTGPELEVRKLSQGYLLAEGGRVILQCDRARQIAPMVKAALLQRVLRDSDDFCAIHAGAVRRGNGCLLLPGASGSGKSTLIAGLVSEGFELLGDDTSVLARQDLAVRPIPLGICIKSNAWPLLSVRFPSLERSTTHDRPDDKRVRYLVPPDYIFADPLQKIPAKWIVFPNFSRTSDTALHPISKSNAFRRFAEFFVPLRANLDSTDIERLVSWVSSLPCYQLNMSSLTQAVSLLSHLCR